MLVNSISPFPLNVFKSFISQDKLKSWDCSVNVQPFLKRQILDSSKIKEFADDNLNWMKIGESFPNV